MVESRMIFLNKRQGKVSENKNEEPPFEVTKGKEKVIPTHVRSIS